MFSFKIFLESYQRWYWLVVVKCVSEGVHGRGDEDDIPAGDPRQSHVRWQSKLNGRDSDYLDPKKVQAADQLFRGAEVAIYENPQTGSYHEQFLDIHVFINLNEEQLEQAGDQGIPFGYSWNGQQNATYQSGGLMKEAKQVGKFQYKSMHDVIEQVVRTCRVLPPKENAPTFAKPAVNIPHTNLDREAWWKQQVDRTIPVNNKRRDLDGE